MIQQQPLDFSAPPRRSLCDKLVQYFRLFPDQWIDVADLAAVAGVGGWRSRVSDLRHAPHGLTIEQRLIHWPDGRNRSQYCYRPAGQQGRAA